MKFFKNIFFAALICFSFQTSFFARAAITDDSACKAKYPAGAGSADCELDTECNIEHWKRPVAPATGLCPGDVHNICCYYTDEIGKATSAGSAKSPAGGCTVVGKDTVCTLPNPLQNNVTDIRVIIKNIITGLLGIIGAISLLMFVWGGSGWLLSAGNPEKVKAGTNTMLWAIIGIVFVFISYTFLNAFFTSFLTGG